MDIHGEDSFGLSRENSLLFRHNHVHHMYFNDFTVPSSKALKDLEDIDALSKHVIMKGLNDDEPNSPPSMDPRSPPRHTPTSALDYTAEPSLKLEDDDELGSTFAFFRKPGHSSSLSQSVDDLLPQQQNGRVHNDFNAFLQPFDLRSKPSDVSHTNGIHKSPINNTNFNNMGNHDGAHKNSDSMIMTPMQTQHTTIINNINHINHISNISTINNINHINHINSLTTYNTINNNINISININPTNDHHSSKPDDLSDTSMDDKSAIHLIPSNSLEFLDDYITTGSNSSSSPDDGGLEDDEMDSGLGDSTASLSSALSSALSPSLSNSSVIMSPTPAISTPSMNGMRASSIPSSLLHTPMNSSLSPSSAPSLLHSSLASLSHSPLSHSTPVPHPSLSVAAPATPVNRLHHSTSSLLPPSPQIGDQSSALIPVPNQDGGYPHPLSASCSLVIKEDPNGNDGEPTPIILAAGGTTVIDGVTYNNRGYEVCGSLNKFNKPCQRIGRCPFHHDSTSPKKGDPATSNAPAPERRYLPIKKGPYKSGWKKDEHIRFLKGLQMHGKGSWKDIALIVGTRTPTQIQVHAHRYYLRQQQETKNKRSIHDISLQDLEELEAQGPTLQLSDSSSGSSPHLSPPSPDRSSDLSHLFCSPSPQSTPHRPPTSPPIPTPSSHSNPHLTPLSPNPLSHSDSIPPPSNPSSPPISAPSSPIAPLSSSSFPPLFSGSTVTSNSLPGLPMLSFPLAPLNYHTSSWYSTSSYNMNQMSNLNSMTINMSGLGDVDLHLNPSSDPKLLSPSSFSHMSDDDYDDDLNSHHSHPSHTHPSHHSHLHSHLHSTHHSDPSSPEEEFPSDDE